MMTEDQISELLTTLDQLREERDEAREIVAKCNNSLFGSYSYFTVLPPKNTTAPDAIENLKSYSGEQWRAAQAAEAELSRIKGERDAMRGALERIAEPFTPGRADIARSALHQGTE